MELNKFIELMVEIFKAWHETEMHASQISTFILN